MQQDLLANGNYASYLAHALTPPMHGAAGLMSGYGANQGISPQFGNPGLGQLGQGQFGQGQFGQDQFGQGNGISAGGMTAQPNFGQQGLQPGFGGFGQHIAAQQQQIAVTLHQLAHQAAAQAMLGQQIAVVLNQLAQNCAWQAQANAQNRHGGAGAHLYGQPFGQAGSFNRPLW